MLENYLALLLKSDRRPPSREGNNIRTHAFNLIYESSGKFWLGVEPIYSPKKPFSTLETSMALRVASSALLSAVVSGVPSFCCHPVRAPQCQSRLVSEVSM